MRDIREYLPFYLGGDCSTKYVDWEHWGYPILLTLSLLKRLDDDLSFQIKPILRPLDSMTEEECKYLAWFNTDSEKLEPDARITIQEIDIDIIPGDGGNMVDADCAFVIEINCRCFVGQLVIKINGDLEMWNESSDERLPLERQAENFKYLLSKHFDIFNLHADGLCYYRNEKGELI